MRYDCFNSSQHMDPSMQKDGDSMINSVSMDDFDPANDVEDYPNANQYKVSIEEEPRTKDIGVNKGISGNISDKKVEHNDSREGADDQLSDTDDHPNDNNDNRNDDHRINEHVMESENVTSVYRHARKQKTSLSKGNLEKKPDMLNAMESYDADVDDIEPDNSHDDFEGDDNADDDTIDVDKTADEESDEENDDADDVTVGDQDDVKVRNGDPDAVKSKKRRKGGSHSRNYKAAPEQVESFSNENEDDGDDDADDDDNKDDKNKKDGDSRVRGSHEDNDEIGKKHSTEDGGNEEETGEDERTSNFKQRAALSVEECCLNGIDAGFKIREGELEMCFIYADRFRAVFENWYKKCDRNFVICCMRVIDRYKIATQNPLPLV